MDLEQTSRNEGGSKILSTHPEVLDENGNKKHSETLLEAGDANRSRMLSEEVADRNGNSSYFEIHPGIVGGSESSDHFRIDPKIYPEVVDRSQSSKKSDPHLEITGGDDSCKHSRIEPNASVSEGHEPILARKLGPSSSSSSSSLSSIEDLFHLDVNEITKSISPKANEDIRPTLMVDENEGCSDYTPKSGVLDHVSPGLTSASQTSGITSEQLANAMSPTTQSPPIQTMDRSGGYDPLRIPSSIFASSKPSTPMEWSVASNESLFSLHIGNSSLRDHLTKSGELTMSGELFVLSPPPASAVAGADGGTNSNHSNESGISRNSFTFPVKKKCSWRSCYRSNCSWTFCYCTQPRRCFRWPSCFCSNCKWPSCRCCNCSRPSCYRSSCSLAFCCHWNCFQKRLHNHSSPMYASLSVFTSLL
ncbi:hypothetical protein HS088_TW02G01068 [Tripterygium wilfordii]|uniref:Uncharacterized protein n=1 Tax=Tripterygium wilfordii TaxID=458696 RepID=A0A7J7E0C1_TRIWF|nr:hypothetical protein HS088_TW02G01068 [Tripterygium wilfordii]